MLCINNLFAKGINPIGKINRVNKIPFQVIVVLSTKGNNTFGQDQDDIILAPYTTVQSGLSLPYIFGSVYVSAKSEAPSEAASNEIRKILRTTHSLRIAEDNDFVILLTAIAVISLVIGGYRDYEYHVYIGN